MTRRTGLFWIGAAMLPLAVASTAWACANLATLRLDRSVASPGSSVLVTGKGYSGHGSTTTTGDSDVTVTLAGRKGTRVGSTVVSSAGRISETMRIPSNVSPGWYVVVATQYAADGTPKPGTPGRARIRIEGASPAIVSPWSPAKPAGPAGFSLSPARDGGGFVSQNLLLWMGLSLSLLAAGSVLAVARRHQTTSRQTLSV